MLNAEINISEPNPVVVAMSGGVDSSVAAAIKTKESDNVIGITLKLYDAKKVTNSKTCCAGADIIDAKKIANTITIPHYVLDYEEIFKKNVIDPFISEYQSGRTPIPCINCNEKVKFLDLINFSRKLGAKSLVTGHYIKKIKIKNEWALYVPEDKERDQSYFLFSIKVDDLDFIDFPLGDFTKNEIRNFAKKMHFHLHDKADSQDICFVPEGDYKNFIKKNIQNPIQGEIVDLQNNVIETHEGIYNFTIGQRRGLGISKEKPMYVKEIDPKSNRVVIAEKEEVISKEIFVKNINYLTEIDDFDIKVRVRSSGNFLNAKILKNNDRKAVIILDQPENAVSPGQACVFYAEDNNGIRLLGGGWIDSTN
ncbi:uncharacterized protein METZ01_LOCUS148128 [marine metagenome]|uniref:Uncharacterized protein n=1 Tax=marine metagenome TaxID=408172 RepID=A0A382A1Q2_9ZZZZ